MTQVSAAIEVTEAAMLSSIAPVLADVFNQAGRDTAKRFNLEGLAGNGNNQYKRDNPLKDRAKAKAARTSHVPVTAQARSYAARNEREIARMIGGKKTDDNAPMDNVVLNPMGQPVHGIEIKTMTVNSNDKITMHPKSLDRKQAWARKTGATVHTVVIDDRDSFGSKDYSGHRLYYARGVGSFRLSSMTKVKSATHLRKLMVAKLRGAAFNEDQPRDDHGQWTDVGALNTSDRDLIDVLREKGMQPVTEKKREGVVLDRDVKFYHSSSKRLDLLKPKEGETGHDKTKVLNLNDKRIHGAWGKYTHEVILPKGTKIFQGMDGVNHVTTSVSAKVVKTHISKGEFDRL